MWVRHGTGGPHHRMTIAPERTGLLFLTIDEMYGELDIESIDDIILLAFDADVERTFHVGPLYLVNRAESQ